jgi:hypothetical protein
MTLTLVGFEVLKALNMKIAVFWDVAPCSLVDIDRPFREAYCLYPRRQPTSILTQLLPIK